MKKSSTDAKPRRILKTWSNSTNGWAGFLKSPKPGSGRKSFAIVQRVKNPDGTTSHVTVKDARLDLINKQFLDGAFSLVEAKNQVHDLMYQISGRSLSQIQVHTANRKLFDEYWENVYSSRDLVDPKASKYKLIRAIESLGIVSIYTGTIQELQKEVDSRYQGNRQREVVAGVNQFMKYIGRKERLRKSREEVKDPQHLNLIEFEKMIQFVPEKYHLIYRVAFATGLRIGELFALRPADFRGDHVWVDDQIDKAGVRRSTKNRLSRSAVIINGWEPHVKAWTEIPTEERLKFRNVQFSKLTRKACEKAFPNQPEKHMFFHALRHSYSIFWGSNGASLGLIAKSLGNGNQVAEKYYAGFTHTTESIQLMRSILKSLNK